MLESEKDFWNKKLGDHWVEISEEEEAKLDDPDDFTSIAVITINSIWGFLSFDQKLFLSRNGKEILENFTEYLDK